MIVISHGLKFISEFGYLLLLFFLRKNLVTYLALANYTISLFCTKWFWVWEKMIQVTGLIAYYNYLKKKKKITLNTRWTCQILNSFSMYPLLSFLFRFVLSTLMKKRYTIPHVTFRPTNWGEAYHLWLKEQPRQLWLFPKKIKEEKEQLRQLEAKQTKKTHSKNNPKKEKPS